ILAPASSYAYVIFAGTPFFTLMMVMNNLVRGEGNTRLSMWSMAISALSNIVMDALFIFVFKWGLPGAALATVISQVLAMVWLFSYYIGGKGALRLRRKNLIPSVPLLLESLRVGASAFIRQIGVALSWAVLNRIFAGTGGDMAVASSGIVQRMLSIIIMPIIGMGHGLLPIVGYNYGAGMYDRVLGVMRLSNILSTAFCFVCAVILFIFPAEILAFFSSDPKMLEMGVPGARLVALGVTSIGMQVMISTFYQGTGKGALSFFLSMLRPLILHPVFAVVLGLLFGLNGAWASFPAADFCTVILTWLIYKKGHASLSRMVKRTKTA
ncbi:MAG: MATE family efflux transporter, partial [Synergistaceae bacterium]